MNKIRGRVFRIVGLIALIFSLSAVASASYTTVNFNYKNWGSFYTVPYAGEQYFAGYLGGGALTSTNIITFDSALNSGQMHMILMNDDTSRVVYAGSTFTLNENYVLKVKDVDKTGGKIALLSLLKNGNEVDTTAISEGGTYLYTKKVGNIINLPLIALHISNVSVKPVTIDTTVGYITIDGIFQISEGFIKVTTTNGSSGYVTVTPAVPTLTSTPVSTAVPTATLTSTPYQTTVPTVVATTPATDMSTRFRVAPSFTLRPVVDVIETNQDGIVELYMNNPSLNDAILNVDVSVGLPTGIYVYGESFGLVTGAGQAHATFSVRPGTERTISITVKADNSARIGSHILQFTGLYYPGDNKDAFQPINMTYYVTVKEASENPEIPSTPSLKSTQIITPTPSKESQLEQEVKELKERLNKTEEKQSQQESRISWLESAINSILDWLKSKI